MVADPSDDPPLSTAVGALCDELTAELPPELARKVRAIRSRLGQPLRVALGGGISAGKSTLVNALLGRRVAEVRPETTRRVTTVYRAAAAGAPESVTLQLANGERVPMAFMADGTLPTSARPDADHWDVRLHEQALAHLTLVDTPGLFSGDPADTLSASGEQALLGAQDTATRDEMRKADALVYLLRDTVSSADVTVLRRYGAKAWDKSGFNAVALVGRADEVQAGKQDPFVGAAEQARDARAALGAVVADVVPVSALLAVTARTHALTDADLTALTALAANPPSDRALGNWAMLAGLPGMAAPAKHLSAYGFRIALRHLAAHGGDRRGLEAALLRHSGLTGVTTLIEDRFLRHSDVIKCEAALRDLRVIAARAGGATGRAVGAEVARAFKRAEFHRVREAHLYQDIARGVVPLPNGLPEEVGPLLALHDVRERLRLPPGADGRAITDRLRRSRTRWAELRSDRSRPLAARRAAQTVLETLRRLQDETGSPARRITRDRHTGGGRHRRGGTP